MDDDFSDSEQPVVLADGEQQDEQHAQKVQGQLEALQMINAELRRELKAEKGAVQKLSSELLLARQAVGSGASSSTSSSSGGGDSEVRLPPDLKQEILAYCVHNNALGSMPHEVGEITQEMCITVLHASARMLKSSQPASRGTTSGTTGARMGTSSSSNAHRPSEKEQAMHTRIKDLESELKLALGAAEDIRALKAKLLQLVERVRIEKEGKMKADAELALTTKKMHMLSDHLEKLMTHLKHEAAAKIRAMEQLRVGDKEMAKVKERSELISRKSSAKDRLVLELREGCKILEDQLRLMDEKYLELRTKLDWARENSEKKVRAAVAKAKELRVKFAMLGNTTPLDKMPLPDIYNGGGGGSVSMSNSQVSGFGGENGDGNGSLGSRQLSASQRAPGRRHSNTNQSVTSLGGNDEPNLDQVLEKIRKKTGGKVDWDDEKLRNLSKSR